MWLIMWLFVPIVILIANLYENQYLNCTWFLLHIFQVWDRCIRQSSVLYVWWLQLSVRHQPASQGVCTLAAACLMLSIKPPLCGANLSLSNGLEHFSFMQCQPVVPSVLWRCWLGGRRDIHSPFWYRLIWVVLDKGPLNVCWFCVVSFIWFQYRAKRSAGENVSKMAYVVSCG